MCKSADVKYIRLMMLYCLLQDTYAYVRIRTRPYTYTYVHVFETIIDGYDDEKEERSY